VKDRSAWLQAFPKPEAAAAVRFLCETWITLADARKEGFVASVDEPDLTFVLAEYLKVWARPKAKLTGRWGQESQGGDIDPRTFRIVKRFRTDIDYSTDRYDPALQLVFEFKKLSDSETVRRSYYGERGMLRFVAGTYSVGHPVALMVGILMDEEAPTIAALRRSLQMPHVRAPLALCDAALGKPFHDPSTLFPDHARFDTDHVREPEKAPSHQTIRIAHVFLGFPDPPPAPVKRTRRKALREALEK
jgi:hypothetical protein